VRFTSLEKEAVAILHAMVLESIIGFFVRDVETIWRRFNIALYLEIDQLHIKAV
jgi:hypothetical protein